MKRNNTGVQIGGVLRIGYLIVLMAFVNAASIYAQCSQLVWSDEFNGTTLDLTKWSYQTGNGTNDALPVGWGNNELQYYTSRTDNVRVTGGNLEIIAKAESYLGANYTSGRIRSTNPLTNSPQNEWQYGSFEARIKMPEPFADSRAWPGFWMLPHNGPWPNTGEIDIVETGLNNEPWKYNGTLHYFSGAHQNSGTGPVTINTASCVGNPGDLSTCFHVYRVDWAPGTIKFFVDGVQIGATMSSANMIGNVWPFDAANKFHLILNMAVGGWFPGTTTPNNTRFPLTMQVDYVRVYSNPSATQITGKTKVMQGDNGLTYTVTAGTGATFNWTVPTGATITGGQGTNTITVNYGATAANGNVSCVITPTGTGCVPVTINLPVSVLSNNCTVTLEDFESNRNLGYNFSTGWLNRSGCPSACQAYPFGSVTNPGSAAPNTSANVGKYERNGGVTYDVIAYNDIAIGDPSNFRTGHATFTMDVRTDAAAGTQVMVQLENRIRAQTEGYPNGIYARYVATTGAPNTWTTLTFTLLDTPDIPMPASQVDQLVLFFKPNSNTSNTYYFDNFKRLGITPATSSITGLTTVCQNNAGITYSVTGMAGSTYNWGVPAGATIVSGQGTNSIVVNFGTSGGNVTVTETSKIKCVGPVKTLTITVTGTCVLTANFAANLLNTCIGNNIIFTNQTTGLTGGETYSWDFGAGASLPAGTTGAGPFTVKYSSSGTKTVVMTVTKGATNNTATKTNYITIAPPASTCLMTDDFNNGVVNWITPIPGAFSHAESGGTWNITNAGYGEWDNFIYATNNGTVAGGLNFGCATNKPVLKIKAKASGSAALRIQMQDGTSLSTDNVPGFNLELTTAWQTFTIDYGSYLRNFYGTPGYLDSTNINKLQFFINPGYVNYPVGSHTAAFSGTVNIDWLGIGDASTCNDPMPIDLVSFGVKKYSDNSAILDWITASEKDNDYFEIQRSRDGIVFTTVYTADGAGNSSQLLHYSFVDEGLNSGTYYYKLNQVDIDGANTYSSVVSINLKQSKSVEVQPTVLNAGETLLVNNYTNSPIDIYLIDLSGRILIEYHNINTPTKEISTTNLNAGVYMVRIVDGNEVVTRKIIIQ